MSGFDSMRRDLVDRGLLDGEFRLTDAGHAHAIALMEELREAEPAPPTRPGIYWNLRRNSQVRGIAQARTVAA